MPGSSAGRESRDWATPDRVESAKGARAMRQSDDHGALTRRLFLRSMLIVGVGASAALIEACAPQAPAPPATGAQSGAQPSKPVLLTSTPLPAAAQPTA